MYLFCQPPFFNMKNKNTVLTLLFVFMAICAYNLYYTYVQFNLDGKISTAESAYNNLPENKATWSAEDSAISEAYIQTLADYESDRKEASELSFTLGLDLQGGMFVTMEVVMEKLLEELAATPDEANFQQALKCASDKRKVEAQPFIPLFIDCFQETNPNEGALGAIFTSEDLDISFGTTDEQVAEILQEKADAALDRTFNIIRARIDQFGVVSPTLQKQSNTDRILLELPGVKDKERVRELIGSTAKLEFYTCYGFQDAYPVLVDINEKIRQMRGLSDIEEESDSTVIDAVEEVAEEIVDAVDGDTSIVDSLADLTSEADSAEDFANLSEAEQEQKLEEYRRENPLFAVLSQPNFQALNPNSPLVGLALGTDTATVNAMLRDSNVVDLIPDDMRFVWSYVAGNYQSRNGSPMYEMIAIRTIDGEPAMGGEAVSTASQDFDPLNGEPLVSLSMTAEGTAQWALITQNNVDRFVSILLDDKVYSYPIVQNAITNGQTRISGSYTVETATDLANILEAGQFPVPARIEGEETVGPSLGEENIASGLNSFLIAFALTLVFMGLYYAKAGSQEAQR